jgi:hypothetical protein
MYLCITKIPFFLTDSMQASLFFSLMINDGIFNPRKTILVESIKDFIYNTFHLDKYRLLMVFSKVLHRQLDEYF